MGVDGARLLVAKFVVFLYVVLKGLNNDICGFCEKCMKCMVVAGCHE